MLRFNLFFFLRADVSHCLFWSGTRRQLTSYPVVYQKHWSFLTTLRCEAEEKSATHTFLYPFSLPVKITCLYEWTALNRKCVCAWEFFRGDLRKSKRNEGQGVRMCVCLVHSRSRCRTRGSCDEDDHPPTTTPVTDCPFDPDVSHLLSTICLSHYFSFLAHQWDLAPASSHKPWQVMLWAQPWIMTQRMPIFWFETVHVIRDT